MTGLDAGKLEELDALLEETFGLNVEKMNLVLREIEVSLRKASPRMSVGLFLMISAGLRMVEVMLEGQPRSEGSGRCVKCTLMRHVTDAPNMPHNHEDPDCGEAMALADRAVVVMGDDPREVM